MNTTSKITARISENGNGLPSLGELCYDSSSDSVYRIIAWDGVAQVSTNGPGCGNSVDVVLDYVGSAHDTTEEEWMEIEAANYDVSVGG